MKFAKWVIIAIIPLCFSNIMTAQFDAISSELDVSVFPENGQDAETQEFDEYKCYKWAKDRTRINPRNLDEEYDRRVERPNTGPDGSVVRSAAGGAVLGALIGAIAGDAKKGAKIGAATGAVGGLGGKMAKDQAKKQEYQNDLERQRARQKEKQQKLRKFKNSFCACMDGKGYSSRF